MKKPWYQKVIISNIPWIIAPILFIGSILGTISDAIDWITLPVTIAGTILVAASYTLLNIHLKKSPLVWITEDNQSVIVNKLGLKMNLTVIGILIALWLPRIFHQTHLANSTLDGLDQPPGSSSNSQIQKLHGVSVDPYFAGQTYCSQVDGIQLKAWVSLVAPYTTWVKTYTVCGGLDQLGKIAHEKGLQVALGGWIDKLPGDEEEIITLINAANSGNADLVIIGNEFLLRHHDEQYLFDYINRVKLSTSQTVKVATAENVNVLSSYPRVLSIVDAVVVSYYPYWEGKSVVDAVDNLDTWYQRIKSIAGGKSIIVSDIWWPICGYTLGEAVASQDNAIFFFTQFVEWARKNDVPYFFFIGSFSGEDSKQKEESGCWGGIWDKDGNVIPGFESVFTAKK